MGSDDLFKKRRQQRKQRKREFKTPKANSFLIVTEGERTEPLYFRRIQKLIEERVGGAIDVVEAPIIDISGEGSSTGKLIEIAEQLVKDAKIIYQNVWVVFDKDDLISFFCQQNPLTSAKKSPKSQNQCHFVPKQRLFWLDESKPSRYDIHEYKKLELSICIRDRQRVG